MSSPQLYSRLRYRITPVGWMFCGIAMAVGLAAVKTQVSLLFLLFGGMLGAVVASGVMAGQMIRFVTLRRQASDRVWQGQRAYLGYDLRNGRWQGPCLGLRVEEVAPQGVHSAAGYCLQLPAGQVFRSGGRFVCLHRGQIALRRMRISTTFPFGLVRVMKYAQQDCAILVWPARGRLKRHLLSRGAVQISRFAPSVVRGGQDEFFGLREYREDDNPRWIHWRKSATRRQPVVREMARPVPEVLWVVVDTAAAAAEPAQAARERAIRFAATLVDYALWREYQVGLALASGAEVVIHRPRGGRGQRRTLLDALALVEPNTTATLAQTAAALHRDALAKTQVLVTGTLDSPAARDALAHLRRTCPHLSAIAPDKLDAVFLDQPLTTPEAT